NNFNNDRLSYNLSEMIIDEAKVQHRSESRANTPELGSNTLSQ
ncbi:32249_t:CDS:1, partial [Racocetra persica]